MLEGKLRENLVSRRDWLIFIPYNYKTHLKKKDNNLNIMYGNTESKINMRVCTQKTLVSIGTSLEICAGDPPNRAEN
jgi:hypothetical protein